MPMPGVIMDNGDRNGSHTNHNRDPQPNGVNGSDSVVERSVDKGKGREPQQNMTPTSPTCPNAPNGMADSRPNEPSMIPVDLQDRIKQLPPEILHITQGLMPLSTLISRFAQKTRNDLTAKILELAQMPVSSAVNGNTSHVSVEDNSAENVNKKHRLLEFAQNAHADWAKAYVITNWSRQSEDVGKLIDLKCYLDGQTYVYHGIVHAMAGLKRELSIAGVPNPDLKTAIQVLSTGKAPWMPELSYIDPPPLTAKDIYKTVEHLNTILTIRMTLHEYDNIPWQFKDFTINSGRVTFKVAGEFEVDLTVLGEDPEAQFWFIDFRFLFSPSLSELEIGARVHLDEKVNAVLKADGLLGCYKLLHEIVLTYKISEFRRQTVELARHLWIDGLTVEPLNRSLSIQYWVDRYGRDGPKSWIILGVHSGRRKDGRFDPRATSRLSIRWFRNAKEVEDVGIPFDAVNISALALLKTIISRHVNFTLTSIYEKMQKNPIFAKREANLNLSTSEEPQNSALEVQLTARERLTVRMQPITGRFIFSPASSMISKMEFMLNSKSRDPASDAHGYIENLRALVIMEDYVSHGLSAGWIRDIGPKIASDEFKSKISKTASQVTWFRRASWLQNWFAVFTVGIDGERWFLLETVNTQTATIISFSFEMQITGVAPVPTYAFFSRLNIYAAALISHYVNLRSLHSRHARHTLRDASPSSVRVPYILLRLSELLPSKNKSTRTRKAWAKESVKLTFQGLEPGPPEEFIPTVHPIAPFQANLAMAKVKAKGENSPAANLPPAGVDVPKQFGLGESVMIITEARMSVPVPKALTILKERVDRDIAFDARSGTFAFRLRSKIGETVIPAFIERAVRVERLVDFIEVLHKHENSLKCEYISLGRIIFTYGSRCADDSTGYKAIVDFGATDSLMTLDFEQGNPHIRIADYLTKILNEKQGLDGVATLLPLTLPALHALDTLEGAWAPLVAKGEVLVFVRAVEWFILCYNISTSDFRPRKITFEIRLQQRRGEPWWYIRRSDTRDKEGDDVDAALKPIWNSFGQEWQGMRVNAVAQPAGIEELLGKLDEVMRNLTSESAVVVPAQVKPPQRAPEAPMMTQRQQPTPNQSQSQQARNTPSQSQGRNTPNQFQGRNIPSQSQGQAQRGKVKREIVEID